MIHDDSPGGSRSVCWPAAAALALASPALAVPTARRMIITGEDYTKWLWGNQHTDGSVYNFTTVPGEGYGDNGQGTEIDLLLASRPSSNIEVTRPHPSPLQPEPVDELRRLRRPQPGARKPAGGDCIGGDCGEFDPRSNEYIKLRGLTARFTPGFNGSTRPPSAPPTSACSIRSRSARSATSTATTPRRSSSRARWAAASSPTT